MIWASNISHKLFQLQRKRSVVNNQQNIPEYNILSKYAKIHLYDVITATLVFFSMRHSHSFNYYAIFFKLTHFVLLFFVLFRITNWQYWLVSFSIKASEKNKENPLKLIYLQILKQNVDSDCFWVTDNEYDHIQVIHCVFSR